MKNGRHYAELVNEQASLVKEVRAFASDKSTERNESALHTEAEAIKALESAGYVRVTKPAEERDRSNSPGVAPFPVASWRCEGPRGPQPEAPVRRRSGASQGVVL